MENKTVTHDATANTYTQHKGEINTEMEVVGQNKIQMNEDTKGRENEIWKMKPQHMTQ